MRNLLALAVVGAALMLGGCTEHATTPEPTPVAPEPEPLPEEIGILLDNQTPTDLQMAPGDAWPWDNPPPYELTANSDVYAVTFIWGSFFSSPTPPAIVTDWSGRISINAVGAVHVHRTIDFEPGEDSVLVSEVPTVAAFVSKTSLDIDGLSLMVFVRNDVQYFAAPWLTFETPPVTLTFDMGELEYLQAFYDLGDGRAVAVLARRVWPDRCPGGFMEGRWIHETIGQSGRFEGLWQDFKGQPIGIMTGTFFVDENGERILDGWVSGYITDQIIAWLKGTWWYDDPRLCPSPWCGTGHGWFRGRFDYADGRSYGGRFVGEFGHFLNPATDVATLPYRGVWHEYCPFEEPVDNGSANDIDAP